MTTGGGDDGGWLQRKLTYLQLRRLLWKSSFGGWQGIRNEWTGRRMLRRMERRK